MTPANEPEVSDGIDVSKARPDITPQGVAERVARLRPTLVVREATGKLEVPGRHRPEARATPSAATREPEVLLARRRQLVGMRTMQANRLATAGRVWRDVEAHLRRLERPTAAGEPPKVVVVARELVVIADAIPRSGRPWGRGTAGGVDAVEAAAGVELPGGDVSGVLAAQVADAVGEPGLRPPLVGPRRGRGPVGSGPVGRGRRPAVAVRWRTDPRLHPNASATRRRCVRGGPQGWPARAQTRVPRQRSANPSDTGSCRGSASVGRPPAPGSPRPSWPSRASSAAG